MSVTREVETKFAVEPPFVLPPLTGVAGVGSVDEPVDHQLEAVYYDTDDLRLARNTVTLRRRTGGHDAGWHLKVPADGAGRDEISRPLGAGDEAVPAELADLVAATTRGAALRPVARIRTRRRTLLVRDPTGRELAEVADDAVRAQTLGATAELSAWREVEVEARGSDGAILPAAATVLLRAGARPAPGPSKLVRALGGRAGEPELPVPASDRLSTASPAREVIQAYLSAQTAAFLAADRRVRLDDPEGVHDMRVAARRLRATLQTFGALVDEGRAAPLRAGLRRTGVLLGAARDGEVQLDRFADALVDLPDTDVLGPVAARIQERLRPESLRGRVDALGWMRGEEYLGLVDDFVVFAARPPWTGRAGEPAGQVLPRLVRKADRSLRRRVRRAMAVPAAADRDVAYHEARKASKRLRYAAEAVAPVYGKQAGRHVRHAKKAQNLLGEHQDGVVAQRVLREFGIAANLTGESSFTYGLLLGGERARAARTLERFAVRWPRLSRARHRRWLRG